MSSVLLTVGACGFGTEAPPPAAPQPTVPTDVAPTPVERETVFLSVAGAASWFDVTVANRADRSRTALPVTSGHAEVLVAGATAQVTAMVLELGDVDIGPELIPPNGVALVDLTLTVTPTTLHSADLVLTWSVRDADGIARPLRAIRIPAVSFDPALAKTDAGWVLSVDARRDGRVWALDGWFEMSDVAFGIVASEAQD